MVTQEHIVAGGDVVGRDKISKPDKDQKAKKDSSP
jgi:hypothetical protein